MYLWKTRPLIKLRKEWIRTEGTGNGPVSDSAFQCVKQGQGDTFVRTLLAAEILALAEENKKRVGR